MAALGAALVVPGAPHADADAEPVRYLDPVFADVTVTSDITYAQATNQQGALQSLELDLYEPTGDALDERPLIVWIHGGSFAYGSKAGSFEQQQGRELARRGFVVASIEYRLAPDPIDANGFLTPEGQLAIAQAYNDGRSAVRYLRTNASTYRIDPDVILASGYSAGGVTADNLAYLVNRNNGLGTETDLSHVDGVIAYAGATLPGMPQPGEPPGLFFHGTADPTVPYSMALDLYDAALAVGIDVTLVAKEGATHDLSAYREEFRERIGWWAYERWLAPAPEVHGLSPRVDPHLADKDVTITGSGFSGATEVRFATTSASFTVVDDTTIVATAPDLPAGVVGVRVTGPGGTSTVGLTSLYRYDGPPRITRVTPNTATVHGGDVIEVRGGGFTGTTSVRFGLIPATFVVLDDHRLAVTVPPRPEGAALVNVWITDDLGTSANQPSSWFLFTT